MLFQADSTEQERVEHEMKLEDLIFYYSECVQWLNSWIVIVFAIRKVWVFIIINHSIKTTRFLYKT
jgi:hypothetical protein